ncbi:peptide-methionine (S)-S-oxide reductase MsrA [Neorhizobium sp. DAR64860/K0K1]|uniref:peptide-methionine (S)-S-oxide reductase MsrA n=1 Tax=Neorhizobium sp. DAR64860/K0K1 TaxID=3421955 RepID=UPI003D27E8E5
MAVFANRLAAAMLTAVVMAFPASALRAQEAAVAIPAPTIDEAAKGNVEKAIFAGGCFWGVQGVFQHVKGVSNAVSGYSGGDQKTATYETVSSGRSGHAEAVEITFDPKQVSYGKLLQIFFSVAHNPTQLNYQGPDRGPQYRSAIFTTSDEQKKVAEAYIAQLDATKLYPAAIVTKISRLSAFYPAEKYHQDFLTLNPSYPYIVYNDMPKIDNLKAIFPTAFRADPVLVSKAKS